MFWISRSFDLNIVLDNRLKINGVPNRKKHLLIVKKKLNPKIQYVGTLSNIAKLVGERPGKVKT